MKLFKVLLFVMMCSIMVSAPAEAKKFDGKVGFVDLSRAFDDYEKTKEYDVVLEQETQKYQTDREAKIEKIRETQSKMELLKDDEKEKLGEELDGLKAELLEYDRQLRTDLTRRRDEKVREILLEIEKVVSDYAKKENYSLILNDRVLIFGGEEYDLTEIILKKLNDSFEKANKK